MRRTVDDRIVSEIWELLRAHPGYGQKRVAKFLADKCIEVDLFELRPFLKGLRKTKDNRQYWAESPLDPKTWPYPPPEYM